MSSSRPTITPDTTIAQSSDVLSSKVDEEIVMLRMESSAYYSTDDIGAEIWRRIAEPITVRDLCAGLVESFAVEPAQCEADVLEFL